MGRPKQLKTDVGEDVSSLLDVLELVSAGRATVNIGGLPFIKVNGDSKTLEVEADAARQAGMKLSNLARMTGGPVGALKVPIGVAGALSQLGWKLTLRAEGEAVLSMGKGSSRLTGRISVNPLKARKLLKVIR